MSRELEWRRRAQAQLAEIARRQPGLARRISDAVTAYADLDHGDVRKLSDSDEYRLRVGDWRVIYTLEDEGRTMIVMRVLNRRDAYR